MHLLRSPARASVVLLDNNILSVGHFDRIFVRRVLVEIDLICNTFCRNAPATTPTRAAGSRPFILPRAAWVAPDESNWTAADAATGVVPFAYTPDSQQRGRDRQGAM